MAQTVAIIGGGASGVAVAINLLREATAPLAIKIIEPRPHPGQGIAYSTQFASHLLNVPAGNMSVFHHAPAHFVEWLRNNGSPQATPGLFAPRAKYGAYLRSVLADAARDARWGVEVEHVRAHATRLSRSGEGFVINTDSDDVIRAEGAVVALGNVPAKNPLPEGSVFKRSP